MTDDGGFVNPGGAAGFLTALLDSADDAILSMDRHGIITYWNAAAERLYGHAAEEIVGTSVSALVPSERKGELERILESIGRGERIEQFETTRLTKDRRTIDVSLIVAPIRAADGTIVGATSIARDMTDRSRFAAESQRAERLEVASRLARGIARELVDLVTAIQGHASHVLEDLAEDPRTGRSAEAVRRATQRAAEVAHQLLALSGDQVLSPRALDLNQAVASSIRLLGVVAGRSTTIDI
jgi:PAS domain S-box-containing protein